MKNVKKIIFIAGGGTGGHLFPALSIGDELQKKGINIIYIGSKYGIEKKIFNGKNVKYILLNIKGIQRGKNINSLIKNLTFPINFFFSYFHSIILVIQHKPIAIIGTGGYSSGMPLLAGITLRTKTFIQDQNSVPGLITKILNKKVKKVFLGYKQAQKFIMKNNYLISGNPIRKELIRLNQSESKNKLKFNINRKLLFIIGGSQGSSPINMHFLKNINFYIDKGYQILWQCGNNDYNFLYEQIKNKKIKMKKFIKNMSVAYSASDLIISRAGALTINEITYFGKASILIPLPNAAENHQEENARILQKNGGCQIINQKDLISGDLEECIMDLFTKEKKMMELKLNSEKCFKPHAEKLISNEIIKHISC